MALTVYQLKVVLRDVKPAVWRRVLVPGDATIRTLHETVQVAMGWANCHLHQFIIHGKEYGVAYEVYWYRTSVLHLAIDIKLTVPTLRLVDTSVGFTPTQKTNSVRVTFSRPMPRNAQNRCTRR